MTTVRFVCDHNRKNHSGRKRTGPLYLIMYFKGHQTVAQFLNSQRPKPGDNLEDDLDFNEDDRFLLAFAIELRYGKFWDIDIV